MNATIESMSFEKLVVIKDSGKWAHDNAIYTFYNNGTYKTDSEFFLQGNSQWKIEDDKMWFMHSQIGETVWRPWNESKAQGGVADLVKQWIETELKVDLILTGKLD